MKPIILASKSKVRKKILDENKIESIVEPSNLDEDEVKKSLINQGVSSVMIGHLLFSKIDPIYPATLSKRLVTDLLRIKLKYDGLVVSDALVMNAISNKYLSLIHISEPTRP